MSDEELDALIKVCRKRLGSKNGALTRKYGIGKHKRWNFDYTTGILEFGPDKGAPLHRFRAFGIGTYSAKGFKWTWASKEVPVIAQEPSARLKVLEQRFDLPAFGVPAFPFDEWLVQSVIALSVEELGAIGCYFADGPNFGTAIAIESVLPADGA
ncbi:MAG TPA: hypothetical protein VF471_06220 [Pseudoxanthomonas sp.]